MESIVIFNSFSTLRHDFLIKDTGHLTVKTNFALRLSVKSGLAFSFFIVDLHF